MKKNSKYSQGIFKPINSDKYIGSNLPKYRSGLELKVFRLLDKNSNVIKWGSETAIVPYVSPVDKRIHRYFIDLIVFLKDKNDKVLKLLIEIKPYNHTLPPKPSKRKKQSTILYENYQYEINQAKWQAAKNWATSKGYLFLVITEKDLFSTLVPR